MAIKVKHEGNVTSRIFAASEGGRGKRRAEDAIRLAEIQSRADIAAQDRSTRGGGVSAPSPGSPGAGHAPSGPSGLISPPFRRNAHGQQPDFAGKYTKGGLTDRWMTEREAEQDYLKANPGATREDVYKHLDSLGHMDGGSYLAPGERAYPSDFKFTSQQKSEFDRLNESYEEARRSGDFSEDELKELRRQIIAKQAGIKPLPTLEDEPQDTWETANSRMFTDPETGRRGYIDKDGVPQFYKDEGAFDKQEFLKRYETVKKDLTKPKFKKDVDGKMIEDGEEIPDANTILKALQEQDKAMELYKQGASTDPGAGDAAPKGKLTKEAFERASDLRRRAALERVGQNPDEVGGYSGRYLTNGKEIPNSMAMFITDKGVDEKAVLEGARLMSERSGNKISVEKALAVIKMKLEDLAADPKPKKVKTPYKPTNVLFF